MSDDMLTARLTNLSQRLKIHHREYHTAPILELCYLAMDDASARIERLEAENKAMREAVDKDLSARMEAAGMVPLDAMTKPNDMTRFMVHAGMTDLTFYAEWLERKAKTYARMQAAHQTGEHELESDMFDFILGKAGAFNEALENYRAALQEVQS